LTLYVLFRKYLKLDIDGFEIKSKSISTAIIELFNARWYLMAAELINDNDLWNILKEKHKSLLYSELSYKLHHDSRVTEAFLKRFVFLRIGFLENILNLFNKPF